MSLSLRTETSSAIVSYTLHSCSRTTLVTSQLFHFCASKRNLTICAFVLLQYLKVRENMHFRGYVRPKLLDVAAAFAGSLLELIASFNRENVAFDQKARVWHEEGKVYCLQQVCLNLPVVAKKQLWQNVSKTAVRCVH